MGCKWAGLHSTQLSLTRLPTAHAVVFLAFTLPKVYELKRAEIDHGLGLAKAKGHELYAKFDEVVLKSGWLHAHARTLRARAMAQGQRLLPLGSRSGVVPPACCAAEVPMGHKKSQ